MSISMTGHAGNFGPSDRWPGQVSDKITADSGALGWASAHAVACNFKSSKRPLCVPSDTEYLTLELNTALSTSVSYQFGDGDCADVRWQPGDIWIYPNSEHSQWA